MFCTTLIADFCFAGHNTDSCQRYEPPKSESTPRSAERAVSASPRVTRCVLRVGGAVGYVVIAGRDRCRFRGQSGHDLCGNPLSRSLLRVKRTSACALQMSAYDPKRTFALHRQMSALGDIADILKLTFRNAAPVAVTVSCYSVRRVFRQLYPSIRAGRPRPNLPTRSGHSRLHREIDPWRWGWL